MIKNSVVCWVDGACSGNPGPGGWAALIRRGSNDLLFVGSSKETTNNRMEMLAAISALEMVKSHEIVTLYSDSQYLVNGITKWVKTWKKNNWSTSSKGRVQNIDLWEKLLSLTSTLEVSFIWIRGHSTKEIDMVDKHAKEQCQNER